MLDDREYMQQPRRMPQWSLTIAILVINAVAWGLQNFAARVFPAFDVDGYFALSLDGLRHGYLWQLVTYQFMHANFLHIFFNSWAIYVFGRVIETGLGKRRMLELYLLSGIAGGLLQMLFAIAMPSHFAVLVEPGHYNEVVVGASAAAYGLVGAAAALFPNQILYLLVFFVIPVKMRMKTLLSLSIAMSVAGIVAAFAHVEYFGSNIGHAAHLGGMILGFWLAKLWVPSFRVPPIIPTTNPKSTLKINPAPD